MKIKTLYLLFTIGAIISCDQKAQENSNDENIPNFQNKGHELVFKTVQTTGDYNTFVSLNNVEYTYTYQTPNNEKDVSQEKYIFDGELSYGKYIQHERTLPQLEGIIEQGYDGQEYWIKHNDIILKNEDLLKRVAFNRPTNFYWFTMMQKLLDPGLNYEYLGEKSIADDNYDIVKVSFESKDDKPTDIYQLYINKKTNLVDQFLFTVADFGVMDTPFLMQVKYEDMDGFLIPTQRLYKKSTWDAKLTDNPWIKVTWSDIQFNTKLKKEDFLKENKM